LRDTPIKKISEFEVIKKYFSNIGGEFHRKNKISLGVGDDCAEVTTKKNLLISCDTSVENVHFYKEINPKFIAYRSCAIALSDINAMGGRPLGYQVSLSTKETNTSFYRDLAKGFKLFSKKYGIGLIGGDITRGQFQLSITIIGEPHKKAIKRSGARNGDYLCISGKLGEGKLARLATKKSCTHKQSTAAYLTPEIKLEYGSMLSKYASSAIDISDGFLQDLQHLSEASEIGFNLDKATIPIARGILFQDAVMCGDDYQILFTIPISKISAAQIEFRRRKMDLHIIGKAIPNKKLLLDNKEINQIKGYTHF
tara:strand:- start:3839 stop:4771 length:933 start_codon:yes stop_codon:yes gene_type:complete